MIATVSTAPFWQVLRSTEANCGVVDQIYSFKQLPDGWHYGDGCSATALAVELALWANLLFAEHNASEVEVFPDVDGGILVSGYHENAALEILCGPNGQIDMTHEDGEDVVYEKKNILRHEVLQYLRGLAWPLMKLSDFFILNTTAGETDDSRVWLSRIPPTTVVCRLLTQNVLENVAEPNAYTYVVSTTPTSQEIQQYFGELTQTNFQVMPDWNMKYRQVGTNVT